MDSLVRDVAARITATAINEVLKELGLNHMVEVEGVAVLPSGTLAYLVDVVMLDLITHGTWAVSFTIPTIHQEQEPHEETETH